ncbi:MAG: hypothetical protein AMXMBFR26_16920 [Porticoccaceae bacterium]
MERHAGEAGFDLAFPRALGSPVCSGRLRTVPEDFTVEELLPADFAFSGAGEHLCLEIRKRGENSRWVARRLAVAAGVAEADVGFCGLKDRHAVTTQWFSVPVRGDAMPELDGLDAEILSRQRHRTKLRRGMHAGNRFRIRLRAVAGDREAIAARLRQLAQGVPNYFGSQRFGIAGNNLVAAQALMQQSRTRGGGRNGLYLSAARSWLFNLVLAARVRDGSWKRPLEGEIRPEGPLWGRGRSPATPAAAAVEAAALADWHAWCHALEHAGLRQERRALVLVPEALSWRWQDADLVLDFRLGRGEFATALLTELGEFAAP